MDAAAACSSGTPPKRSNAMASQPAVAPDPRSVADGSHEEVARWFENQNFHAWQAKGHDQLRLGIVDLAEHTRTALYLLSG